MLAGLTELRNVTWVDLPTSHWPMWSRRFPRRSSPPSICSEQALVVDACRRTPSCSARRTMVTPESRARETAGGANSAFSAAGRRRRPATPRTLPDCPRRSRSSRPCRPRGHRGLVRVDVRLGGGVAHEVGQQALDDPVPGEAARPVRRTRSAAPLPGRPLDQLLPRGAGGSSLADLPRDASILAFEPGAWGPAESGRYSPIGNAQEVDAVSRYSSRRKWPYRHTGHSNRAPPPARGGCGPTQQAVPTRRSGRGGRRRSQYEPSGELPDLMASVSSPVGAEGGVGALHRAQEDRRAPVTRPGRISSAVTATSAPSERPPRPRPPRARAPPRATKPQPRGPGKDALTNRGASSTSVW